VADDFSEEQAKVVDGALFDAVEKGDFERVNLCLQKGADIDARNASQRTPLMMAVWYENARMTQFLLSKRPSLFLKDKEGKTAYDLIRQVRDSSKQVTITDLMLRALPDHIRARTGGIVQAAAEAEAEAEAEERATAKGDAASIATGADITVLKPIALPSRNNPKGFKL
jgi:ankyrin repeat protein